MCEQQGVWPTAEFRDMVTTRDYFAVAGHHGRPIDLCKSSPVQAADGQRNIPFGTCEWIRSLKVPMPAGEAFLALKDALHNFCEPAMSCAEHPQRFVVFFADALRTQGQFAHEHL
jgi:hypothetical protein